ncbi:hypothetical protein [Yinghuangia seranimata]|uniref:hypothetical protein n=1 Tax=Yinghuangia seranimata TaxID=408067 RepID=UPI00248B62B5|nr:hypothetical protein [Yinghuangia seranimata]MDI2128824.1 hypothetical protein [Yinghuangia seranimata]
MRGPRTFPGRAAIAVAALLPLFALTGCLPGDGPAGKAVDAGTFRVLDDSEQAPASRDEDAKQLADYVMLTANDWGTGYDSGVDDNLDALQTTSFDADCRLVGRELPKGTPASLGHWYESEETRTYSAVTVHQGSVSARTQIAFQRDGVRRCPVQHMGDDSRLEGVAAVALPGLDRADEVVADHGRVVYDGEDSEDVQRYVSAIARKGSVVAEVFLLAYAHDGDDVVDQRLRDQAARAVKLMLERLDEHGR